MNYHFSQLQKLGHVCLIFTILFLSACTKEESIALKEGEVAFHGAATKGPLSDATISVYAMDVTGNKTGASLAQTTTVNGSWSVTVSNPNNELLLVESTGGEFIDESDPEPDITKKRKITLQAGETLQGILIPGEATASINYFTYMLLQNMRKELVNSVDIIQAFNRVRSRAFNSVGFDPFTEVPADPITPAAGATDLEKSYALLIGGAAYAMNNAAIAAGEAQISYNMIKLMVDDLADCNLDGVINGVAISSLIPTFPVDLYDNISINNEIVRFRNNNSEQYTGVTLPVWDDVEFCNSTPVLSRVLPSHLTSLNFSSGTLEPDFILGRFNYNVYLPYEVSSITLIPVADTLSSTIQIDANTVVSGQASSPISLAVGDNMIRVTVLAEDGITETGIDITVTRNDPPVFSTSSSISVQENTTAIGNVVALDSDGGSIVYSIGGGADASLFEIDSASGALSFISSKNFESPSDNDTNNIYLVDISATDQVNTAGLSMTVTVTDINDELPISTNVTVTTNEDTNYVFSISDFSFSDLDAGDTLSQIQIVSLETVGSLKFLGGDVLINQNISFADINSGNLQFSPVANANGSGYDIFTFKVHDGLHYSFSSNSIIIDITPVNDVPVANAVNISDNNGGYAVIGDILTGNYTYSDIDGDVEMVSTYRWLNNGVEITGANQPTYTLVATDVPARITFEITPGSADSIFGTAVSSTEFATGTAPVLSGMARYLDINNNGNNDANDQVIISFDQTINVNSASVSDFNLPVTGDTFGIGATVNAGPGANEITIFLGSSPSLKTRQNYTGSIASNSPTGLDISGAITANSIVSLSGITAISSTVIDVIPGYVDSLQSLGTSDSYEVVVGDVDSDGDIDIVVANYNQGNRIYLNNGSGVFTDSGQSLGVNKSQAIALGDLDGDGDLDIAVANDTAEGEQVYLNNGSGVFTDSGQSLGTDTSMSISLGDIDSDGDLDMLVATLGQGAKVYSNNGAGIFTDTAQALGTGNSSGIELGDVDSDGDLDMVVANLNNQADRLYLNNGTGIFTDSGQTLGASTSNDVALGDLDGDGDLDMVVGNGYEGNLVYFNNGAGIFTDSGQSMALNDSESIALGDIDGDGNLDITVANNAGEYINVYMNNGSGFFTDSISFLGGINVRWSIALGDMDNDGDLDMVTADYTQGNRIYLNSLTGTQGATNLNGILDQTISLTTGNSGALADIDGDGDSDMVIANGPSSPNQVFVNDGAGVFTDSGQALGLYNSKTVELGDLDNDGDVDLVVANGSDQANRVYFNNGAGIFTDSGQALGASTSTAKISDIDSDGDLDIVVANVNGQPNRVYFNNGAGTFTDSGQALGVYDSKNFQLGDIDNDGDVDIVVANRSFEPNRIYINNGVGVFTDSTQMLGMNYSKAVDLVDFDNDGDIDAFFLNDSGIMLYRNDGTGDFINAEYFSYETSSDNNCGIVVYDIENNGILDIVVSTPDTGIKIYKDGSPSSYILRNESTRYSILKDLDNDGDIELIGIDSFFVKTYH